MNGTEISERGYLDSNRGISLKVFLAYCPQSHPPTSPHPALPYLKGYLGQVLPNVSITQKDLDAIYFSHIFNLQELGKRFHAEVAERIREAYEGQRDVNLYRDLPRFINAHQTLEYAINEISRQHREKHRLDKESLKLSGNTFTYVSEYPANDITSLLEAINPKNRMGNLFYPFYSEVVIPHITEQGYHVIGLSNYLTDQLIPTFLLASMVKEASPSIRVILGGNYISRFGESLGRDSELNRELLKDVDVLVLKNGELAFRDVLEEIASGNPDFSNVGQVLYKENGGVVSNRKKEYPNVHPNLLPRANFEGIFTGLDGEEQVFWTPKPVISFYTARGCPYVKNDCRFCGIPKGNTDPSSGLTRSPKKVAEDMGHFQETYGTKFFSFGNETLSKNYMLTLTKELNMLGIEAVIDGYTRTDQFEDRKTGRVDMGFIRDISKYFKFLQIGFESNDEQTLWAMRKGRKPFNDTNLVVALFENGIMPHAFLMIGYPPEEGQLGGGAREDYINFYINSSLGTLKWVYNNRDDIGTFKATALVLPRDSDMIVLGEGGIRMPVDLTHEIKIRNPRDLEYNVPYDKKNGSVRLDRALVELFDLLPMPYRTFTHHAIYHQRQFMWDEGIRWSKKHPKHAELLSPIDTSRERKVLQTIWREAVGRDYAEALRELSKKGGVSREKRERLEALVHEVRERNIIARDYPEGISSMEEFVPFDDAQEGKRVHLPRYARWGLAAAASLAIAAGSLLHPFKQDICEPEINQKVAEEFYSRYYPGVLVDGKLRSDLSPGLLDEMHVERAAFVDGCIPPHIGMKDRLVDLVREGKESRLRFQKVSSSV